MKPALIIRKQSSLAVHITNNRKWFCSESQSQKYPCESQWIVLCTGAVMQGLANVALTCSGHRESSSPPLELEMGTVRQYLVVNFALYQEFKQTQYFCSLQNYAEMTFLLDPNLRVLCRMHVSGRIINLQIFRSKCRDGPEQWRGSANLAINLAISHLSHL